MSGEIDFKGYWQEHDEAIGENVIKQTESLQNMIGRVRRQKSTLWVLGNGGSATTASHAVVDFMKTTTLFGASPLRTICLTDSIAHLTAESNDRSFETALRNMLAVGLNPNDLVLFLSVSGSSENLIRAAEYCAEVGVEMACIVGKNGKNMASLVDVAVLIESEDYQIVENLQLVIIHWIVKKLQ
jgi:D-sedoheptulose 7-phosphate isomerase